MQLSKLNNSFAVDQSTSGKVNSRPKPCSISQNLGMTKNKSFQKKSSLIILMNWQ